MKWSLFGGALYSAVNQMSFSQQKVLLQFQLKSAKTLSIVFIIAAILQLVQMGRSFSRANYSRRREWAEEGEQLNPFGFINKPLPPVTWFLFVSVIFSLCAKSKQGHTRPKSKWSSSFGWRGGRNLNGERRGLSFNEFLLNRLEVRCTTLPNRIKDNQLSLFTDWMTNLTFLHLYNTWRTRWKV